MHAQTQSARTRSSRTAANRDASPQRLVSHPAAIDRRPAAHQFAQLAALANPGSARPVQGHLQAPAAFAAPVIQRAGSAVRYPGQPNQLSVTYSDGFERDLNDDPYAFLELNDDFMAAAVRDGLTDAVLAPDRKYRRAFNIVSARFSYSACWDGATSRLLVLSTHYIGPPPAPDFMVPSAVFRQRVAKHIMVQAADLPSIDWLFNHMRWDMATVGLATSSGDVVTFIPGGGTVVQYYRGAAGFAAATAELEKLRDARIPGVAGTRVLGDPALRLLEVEKLLPLNSLSNVSAPAKDDGKSGGAAAAAASAAAPASPSSVPALSPRQAYLAKHAPRLFIEIRAAVLAMAERGVSQGDVRIDNIGLRDRAHALFDFNLARTASKETVIRDLKDLIASLKHHGVKVPAEYEANPLAKGPWG